MRADRRSTRGTGIPRSTLLVVSSSCHFISRASPHSVSARGPAGGHRSLLSLQSFRARGTQIGFVALLRARAYSLGGAFSELLPMIRLTRVFLWAALCAMLLFLSQQSSIGIDHHLTMGGAQRRNARNVRRRRKHSANPFIGTAGYGHCTPGAHAPFGMITIAPLSAGPQLTKRSFSTLNQGEYSAGYQHKDKFFRGMAHTATSGAGIVLGLDLVVSPFRGLGAFEDERATPGYYAATLTDGEPTQHAMERARKGHTLRFQALKRKARAMLRARRLAREAAKAVREARLRGENVRIRRRRRRRRPYCRH